MKQYQALSYFESIFHEEYRHRSSSHGNIIGRFFLEDLLTIDSSLFKSQVEAHACGINTKEEVQGTKGRRGDGTFGEFVPGSVLFDDPGFAIATGPIATIEIGVEVKILAKAMIKQIDRVMTDIESQKGHFERKGGRPISIAIVGINFAERYTSYEGERSYPTEGKKHKHPIQEAPEAKRRVIERIGPKFDELILLEFLAENVPPFKFRWKNGEETRRNYAAALLRVVREYGRRFKDN